jgi:hypothetical protein
MLVRLYFRRQTIAHEKNIRLQGRDYSGEGNYFVTICTECRETLFGKIENDTMVITSTHNNDSPLLPCGSERDMWRTWGAAAFYPSILIQLAAHEKLETI